MYSVQRQPASILLTNGERCLRIAFLAPAIARITFTSGKPFSTAPSYIVAERTPLPCYTLHEDASHITLTSAALSIRIDLHTAAITYLAPTGEVLTHEPRQGGKWLTPKSVFHHHFERDEATAFAPTAISVDGARAAAARSRPVFDRTAFEARLDFIFSPGEALFGLGSHEEGYGNLRGRSRELYQQNMKAVVPVLVSTRGYAVLLDCGSLMTFHDDALGSYWWADTVDELDFYFIAAPRYNELSALLRRLTGNVPLPPRWLFGFAQSKERYVNADEMLCVVREYRRRNVPLDLIVLDWKSWPNGPGWGQKSLDPVRFPAPRALTDELHALGARLMVSIWPIMTGGCPDQRELLAAERNAHPMLTRSSHEPNMGNDSSTSTLMLGNQATYNAFSSHARSLYWDQARRGLFDNGVDAWWCDCTEPFEADWTGAVKPEPHTRLTLNTELSKLFLDPARINLYSLLHSQGIYQGQRSTDSSKRVVNLTRSSYAGQSRYGTITWSGDITATWETLRRSIPEGLNFCATGEPYWTLDIGGFFLANDSALWFWRGDYNAGTRGLTPPDALSPDSADTGSTDLGFHELYTRWLQYAAFLPVFRSHGTDAAREIWRFGEPGTPFYDAIADAIRLRYTLLPYLYSLAAAVTFQGHAMLSAVALQYPEDSRTHDLVDQFLLGPSLLVCPVTHPMRYGPNSQPLGSVVQSRQLYLPAGRLWFDLHTGECHQGGTILSAPAPIDRIPVYVPAGSILPLAPVQQFTSQDPGHALELRIYTGADAEFILYEDAGDSYAYEHGECATTRITWCERDHRLCIHPRIGSFPELVAHRTVSLVFITPTSRYALQERWTGEQINLTS